MIEIIHEDPWILVVNKPFGVLTQAPLGIANVQAILEAQLWERDRSAPRPFIGVPHRLDRVTTGVMVFARNQRALRRLCDQFAARTVDKVYRAIVEGDVPAEGTWHDHIRKIPDVAKAEIVEESHPEGRSAVLHFKRLASATLPQARKVSLVELTLESGRMHQIRIQFSGRGFPVVGDLLYGSTIQWRSDVPVFEEREPPIALHAHQLRFRHPKTVEALEFIAPVPGCWQDVPFGA